MRKDGIGYLPKFDETVTCVRELLEFFQEERGIIEFAEFVEDHFRGKGRSRSTIRLLQNTLSNYGLIRETQDYVYVITNLGQQWLKNGSSEKLIEIIHEHISYVGEILLELEKQKLSREELQKRAFQFYGIELNNTDLTRRLQVLRSTGMVTMNRRKEYTLTIKGSDFLHNITLENKKTIRAIKEETKEEREEKNRILKQSVMKSMPEETGEMFTIKELCDKIGDYLRNSKSTSIVTSCGEIQCNTAEGVKVIEPDILVYYSGAGKNKLQLVVEIVIGESRTGDFLEKLFDYKKIGVEECWMVDYTSGNIMVYDWKKSFFNIYKLDDVIRSSNFSGLNIDFSKLKKRKKDIIVLNDFFE